MNSPINRMIESSQKKTAAVTKNVGNDTRTLEQKVIQIVASANKMALPDRQVVPRNALVVMERAMNELSSLSDESKEAGVLREVNKFISLNQNTFRANDSYAKHTDLLPAGHPLSDHNSSLSTEDYLQRYAAWLSADPGISDDVRHLVAAAYSQLPGSPQREHAFIRLNAIKASSLPAYFKIDIPALVAAFSFGDGNSSAARRARVKLQWRDRLGRWVEMGRGINFKFRLPDGGVATAAGTYIGSDSNAGYSGNWARKEANNGLVEVTGSSNIPDGIYSIRNNNAEVYKARLSDEELKRAGVDADKNSRYRLSSQFDESIPDLNDLLATKVDGPSGWTKNEDGSFTSDDDYKVVKKDDGYEVYRLDPEGNTGDKVGDAKTWADVQNVAAADEEAYDKYKEDVESGQLPLGDGKRPEPRYSRMNREVQQEIKQLKDQIPQNEESNKRIEDQLERALSGKDSQGRDLPEGWYSKIDPTQISENYYKDIPGATRKDEYIVAIVGNDGVISYGSGGFWFNNAKPATTWEQVTEDTPKIIDQINSSRAVIGLDPIGSSELGDFTQLSKKDYQNIRSKVDSTRNRLYTQDGFAFSRNETGFGGYSDEIIVTTEDWEPGDPEIAKIESDGGIDWSNDAMYDTWADSLRRAVNTDTSADQVSDKEIFDRRMAGESLQEVADSLGIPREEVRAREAKYARENPPTPSPGASPVRTRKVGNIDIPLYSRVVAKEQNGDAVIVRMRDGSWVQYDTEGKEGMPWTDAKRDELIDDIKNNRDTIWFDEQGKRIFSEMLKNEIDETFPYNEAKRIALDSSKSAQERHAAVFDGAKGTDFFEFVTQDGVSPEELDPSIPKGTEIVFLDGDGQSLTLRYPDGSYHYVDTGGKDENNLISPQSVEELDQESTDKFLAGLFDPEGLPYARGSFIDGLRQNTILSGSSDEPIERYIVDFETLGSSDMFDGIPELEDEDPTEMTEEEALQKWLEAKGLSTLGVKVVSTSEEGLTKRVTFDIPTKAKEAFGEAYGLDLDENLGDGIDKVNGDGPDEPPSRPTGGGNPGSGFTDYVIDLAEDNADLGKDLEEKLDDDAEEAGIELMDQIYEDASRRYELSQDIADNKPEGMSDDEFVRDAVAKMREQLSSIVDSAIDERRAFEDDEELEVDFDKKAFVDAGAKRFEELLREELDNMDDDDDGDGPDEPPTPPSGGLPPKSPPPSNPTAPALFNKFDVPSGAFQLRTVEYEPEGRVDETSTDFTDAPNRLAVRFPLDTLVRAFTRSLIGDVDENVIEDIVDINDDGDGNLPDLSEVGDVLENNLPINVPRGERPRASGAGSLEFNAGSEFVQAEALYNAVWLAGGDPNRVIANAYDAVNGNRDNLSKLIEAQGGVPTPEEEKLIVDITDEIKQIDDATPEEEKPITNADSSVNEDDMEFPGNLIENIPVDFNNPDYYLMDLSPYIATILEPDELGYTDNPKYIAIMVKSSSDLIQQMKSGITDGTGMALVRFNDDSTSEVPVEAIRDALQYQGLNTNNILFTLNSESNNLQDEEKRQPQAHSQMIKDLVEQAGGTVDDETADKIRDAINEKGLVDWSEADDAEIIEAITEVAGPGILEQALAELAPETPTLVLDYPGPRKKGYSSENTTLDLNGNVVGEGSTVQAVTDGKIGKVLKIQDSPAYLRIEFTDGTVAVRSANKIFAVSNKDGSKPSKPSAATAPSEIERDPVEISRRLDTPVAKAPAVARSGDTYGVNDESTVPDSIKELAQVNVVQKDFSQWGVRDAEIAKAAAGRVGVEPLYELIVNYEKNRKKTGDDKPSKDELAAANNKLQEVIADAFGGRTGVSFGSKFYTVTKYGTVYFSLDLATEEDNVGKIKFEYSARIRNESGNPIGSVTRVIAIEKIKNQDDTFSYKMKPYNSYMKVDNKVNQKTGFASAYNRYMENWYIANNAEQVRVFAAAGAAFEGGFVWALNGFDWDLSRNGSVDEIKYALGRLRRESETVYEKAVADILIKRFKDALDPVTQKYDASKVPTPMDVALAGWREGSTNWPGRRAMLDTGWHGVKNLVPSAREQVQAINYRKIKNAERRVKTGQNKPNLSSTTLSYLNSNEFQTEYAALGTSMDIIRSVLRNNESLATLSESDKVKLYSLATKEIFSKDSKIPTSDINKLRTALIKEYNADYSSTDPFSTVGEALTKFSIQQFEDGSELEAAGFKVEVLSDAQGAGINQTYRVIHNDSGQVFYVKDDSTTRDRINERRDFESSNELNYPTIVAELEASVLFNLSGLFGTYSTRGSTTDENLIVMSSAGATLPTYESPINASDMFSLGLNTPSGQKFYGIDSKKLLDNLKSPEDVFRVHIVDALMNNMDRHIGNWKAAIDLIDNKILIFPVDHTLTDLNVNDGLALAETKEFLDYGRAGSALYKDTIPAIIDRAGKERAYEVYKNEVQRMIDNIDDPLVVPKENELAFLISKWGSYDAFKDSMKKRLSAMIEDGTEVNTSLRNIFNKRRGL